MADSYTEIRVKQKKNLHYRQLFLAGIIDIEMWKKLHVISSVKVILCLLFLLQSLLFNPPPNSKPFSRGQSIVGQDLDLYIDCFVSCFRITPHNNDVLKVCLNPLSPPIYHFVLVNALHRIITQVSMVYQHFIVMILC